MRNLKTILVCPLSASLLVATATFSLASSQSRSSKELVLTGKEAKGLSRSLRPLPLPEGRLLVAVNDTVYLLDANEKQLWKYENTTLTTEPAYNASLDEIAIVMYDLQAVRLAARTGKVVWKAESVGRGVYSRVCPYDRGFLVVVDMSGYSQGGNPAPTDRLEYWGQFENDSWSVDFPHGAELVVSGARIYALRRSEGQVRLREIEAHETKAGN